MQQRLCEGEGPGCGKDAMNAAAPAADHVNKFPGTIIPPQIPFNRMEASSQPGDARAVGAKSPQEHALSGKSRQQQTKKPGKKVKSEIPGGASLAGALPVPDGKNPSKSPYLTIRTPLFPSYEADG